MGEADGDANSCSEVEVANSGNLGGDAAGEVADEMGTSTQSWMAMQHMHAMETLQQRQAIPIHAMTPSAEVAVACSLADRCCAEFLAACNIAGHNHIVLLIKCETACNIVGHNHIELLIKCETACTSFGGTPGCPSSPPGPSSAEAAS